LRIIRSCVQEYADAPHPLGLLRARRGHAAAAPPSSVMRSRRGIIL
jgi:hypothetical protein